MLASTAYLPTSTKTVPGFNFRSHSRLKILLVMFITHQETDGSILIPYGNSSTHRPTVDCSSGDMWVSCRTETHGIARLAKIAISGGCQLLALEDGLFCVLDYGDIGKMECKCSQFVLAAHRKCLESSE